LKTAEAITRESKSNLALTFISLGGPRRRDITTLYAFCRVIDDIADSPAFTTEEKASKLTQWRQWLARETPGEDPLAHSVRGLMQNYPVTLPMLEEIISGVEMDLRIVRYETWEELRQYCYLVASAVGLVSIEIFGYKTAACREYAIELGLALQITNILRDVRKDFANGRIYLPREEMARFGYSEADLAAHLHNDAFLHLMEFEAARAHQHFQRAQEVLPREDRRSMVAAQIMASIYRALLRRMEADRFRVFERDYALSKPAKIFHVARQLVKIL
jgi:phytoene synthase